MLLFHTQGPPRRKRPWETCKCTRAGVAHFFKAVAKLCVRTWVLGVARAKTWVAQSAHGVVQSCLECFCHTRSKAHKYKKTLSVKVRYLLTYYLSTTVYYSTTLSSTLRTTSISPFYLLGFAACLGFTSILI